MEYKSDLPEKARKYKAEINKKIPRIMAKMAGSYAETALKYVPPGMKSKKTGQSGNQIAGKFYKRELVNLKNEIKNPNNKLTAFDKMMLGKKFKYRLLSNKKLNISTPNRAVKSKRGQTFYFYYFKDSATAKAWQTIQNRGLLKVMFGLNLQKDLKEELPKNLQRLLKKSPELAKLTGLNRFIQANNDDKHELTIENLAFTRLAGAGLQGIVNNNAEKSAKRTAKKQFQKLSDQEIEL